MVSWGGGSLSSNGSAAKTSRLDILDGRPEKRRINAPTTKM
jgi:hypothetical protein